MFWHKTKKYLPVILCLNLPQVRQGDGLPDKVCLKCYCKLYSAYKLKHLAESSHNTLISHLGKKPGVKEEVNTDIKEEIQGSVKGEGNDLDFLFGLDNIPPPEVKGEEGSPPEREDEGTWPDDEDNLPLRICQFDKKPSLPEVKKEINFFTEKDAPQILLDAKGLFGYMWGSFGGYK